MHRTELHDSCFIIMNRKTGLSTSRADDAFMVVFFHVQCDELG